MNDWMMNPLLQTGLGILGANRPGATFGQAVGGGAAAGIGNLMALQDMKERSDERKVRAEIAKQEMERAKMEWERQSQMDQAAQQYVQQNPQYAPLYQFGGSKAVADAMSNQFKDPTSYREWERAGRPGTYEDWLMRSKKASASNISVNPVFNPLRPNVEGDVQSKIISSDIGGTEARVALDLVNANPNVVGWLPKWSEKASGVIGSAAEFFDSDVLRAASAGIRPIGEGGASATDIQSQLLATKTAAREIMAPDKGPLTQQEQADYKESLGMLDSSDVNIVRDGLEMLIATMDRRATRLKEIARMSGATVPGEMPPRQEDLEYTAKKYGMTVDEVKRMLAEGRRPGQQ